MARKIPRPVGRYDYTEADKMRDRGEDPVDRAACPHGGLLLTEDPDIYDCPHGCGDDYDG